MSDGDDNLSTLLSSASILLVATAVGKLAKLVERIVVGRALSPSAYGEVSVGIALLLVSVQVSIVGFNGGIPRYISRYESFRDRRGVWVTGLLVTGGLMLLVVPALYLAAPFLTNNFLERADSPALIRYFVLAIPFVVWMRIGLGSIRGFENTAYKVFVNDLFYPISRILLIAALLFAGYGIVAVGYAYVVTAAIAFVVTHVLLNRIMPLVGEYTTHSRELLAFSIPLVASDVITLLLMHTDTFMLAYFSSSADVGLYTAAFPVANGLTVVLASFGFLYLPITSRLDSDGDHDEISRLYETVTKWAFIVTFPGFLTFVVFPDDIMRIFFGAEYAGAGLALVILSFGYLGNVIGGRNKETLLAVGLTNYLFAVDAFAYGLNLVMNLLLIPVYGFVGAAVASATSVIAVNVGAFAILKWKYDITPFSTQSLRTFFLLPVLLLPTVHLLSSRVTLTMYSLLPFLVAVGIATVVIVVVTGCLTSDDRVALEFVEETTGVTIPFVRDYLPAE